MREKSDGGFYCSENLPEYLKYVSLSTNVNVSVFRGMNSVLALGKCVFHNSTSLI